MEQVEIKININRFIGVFVKNIFKYMFYVFVVKVIDGYKCRVYCYLLWLIQNNMYVFFVIFYLCK